MLQRVTWGIMIGYVTVKESIKIIVPKFVVCSKFPHGQCTVTTKVGFFYCFFFFLFDGTHYGLN